METLAKEYEELINGNKWSYYDDPPELSYDTIFSNSKAFEFIKNYFSRGGKETLFEDQYLEKRADAIKDRAPHIVSTYLLGILIAESLGFGLCKNNNNSKNLKYLWFLSCLYHDIGYIYELNSSCEQLRNIQAKGLTALWRICNIEYHEDNEFKTYNKEEIDLYLSYRAKCLNGKMGVIDHGIAGGLMLYDRLRRNYERAWEKANDGGTTQAKDSFCYHGLRFSMKHLKYYAEAADAVISHNIWTDTLMKCLEGTRKESSQTPKIKARNKTAFLLALADTIEPIKRYGFFALNEIYYEKEETTAGFYLQIPSIIFGDARKNIVGLQDWVDVSVSEKNNNTLYIHRNK